MTSFAADGRDVAGGGTDRKVHLSDTLWLSGGIGPRC
jgi:hypothetical protein